MENRNYKEKLKDITAFIFDVDGVFTNTRVFVNNNGDLLWSINMKDGYVIRTAVIQGCTICILIGGGDVGVQGRFENLGAIDISMLHHQEFSTLLEYRKTKGLKTEQVLYMSNDLSDISPVRHAGLATCPQDAVPKVKAVAHYIFHRKGEQGVVRNVVEQVLEVREDWEVPSM